MADPTLKKTSVQINYSASDGYRAEFGAKAGTGSKNRTTGAEVPPEKALLAGLEELSRLLCLFGFEREAFMAFDDARKAVADWRTSSVGNGARDGGEMSNIATVPADKLAELQREAARYRWLTKHAYVGVCYVDQGTILEVGGCDRRVPDEVGEFCDIGKAIDAAMAADEAPRAGSMGGGGVVHG